jgi:hypothetical protein
MADDDDTSSFASSDDDNSLSSASSIEWSDWLSVVQEGNGAIMWVSGHQWRAWLSHACSELENSLRRTFGIGMGRENGDIEGIYPIFGTLHMISLANSREFRRTVAHYADHFGVDTFSFDLKGIDETIEALAAIDRRISVESVIAGVAATDEAIRRVGTYKPFPWCFTCKRSSDLNWVSAILKECHIHKLFLKWDQGVRIEDDQLVTFQEAFYRHSKIKDVDLVNMPKESTRAILSVLLTIPNLTHISLKYTFEPWTPTSDEDLREFCQILSLPTLTSFKIINLQLDSTSIAESFCRGLRGSNLTSLAAHHLSFPDGMERALADALIGGEVRELGVSSFGKTERGCVALASSLARSSTPRITLTLGKGHLMMTDNVPKNEPLDADIAAAFFEALDCCFFKTVKIYLETWNDAIDKALAGYVRRNDSLEELSVFLPLFCRKQNELIASAALLQAVDTNASRLREFKYGATSRCRPDEFGWEKSWYRKLKFILELNSHRREHAAHFQCITSGNDLAEALRAIDRDYDYDFGSINFLFEYIRCNEWNIQKIIKHYGGNGNARKRQKTA